MVWRKYQQRFFVTFCILTPSSFHFDFSILQISVYINIFKAQLDNFYMHLNQCSCCGNLTFMLFILSMMLLLSLAILPQLFEVCVVVYCVSFTAQFNEEQVGSSRVDFSEKIGDCQYSSSSEVRHTHTHTPL